MANTTISSLTFSLIVSSLMFSASSPAKAIVAKSTKPFYGDVRLRYESVDQDNALPDADALTLRSRIGYKTAQINGFSAVIEGEVSTEIIDDFSVPPAAVRTGEFSVIADPETAEVDQAYIQYSAKELSAKVGRQVITLDGHRFVGHVGWRQDRQTFDALSINYKPTAGVALNASYIDKRNRIFAQEQDLDTKDVLLNAAFKTSLGKIVSYAYLFEVDNNTDNSLDTVGVSLKGEKKLNELSILYAAEFASQENNNQFDTDYVFVEGGIIFNGITAKLAYEILSSDDGLKGFATPLATLHKFNGWADTFLATPNAGLEDLNLSISGKLLGGQWLASYHDYSADFSAPGADNLGDELNLSYARKFGTTFSGGMKLANYSAGDVAFNNVDTDKFWLWAGAKF